MILIKRIVTSFVLFVIFFVLAYFAICVVGGAISGAIAGASTTNAQEGYALGQEAGTKFVKNNITAIFLSSLVISFISSLTLSFSGILPWCKEPRIKPDL